MTVFPPPLSVNPSQPGSPRFVAPPQDEVTVYPYRRVWISVIAENVILFLLTLGLFFVFTIFQIDLPSATARIINIALAFVPVGLWLLLSLLRERFVAQPRQRLVSVVIVSSLAANAVGVPFVEAIFQPKAWLPLEDLVNRIVGYTVTVTMIQELLKYIVVRSLVWGDLFRVREDSVAYGAASAVGYALVVNLHFAFQSIPLPQVMAARVFEISALGMASSLIVAFGLSELRFARPSPSPIQFVGLFALACLVGGAATALRSNFVSPSFTLRGAQPNELLGILLTAVLFFAVVVIVLFLFRNAVRQEREAAARAEV